ncbi:hypothetical protein [Paraflavitalea pollutisoli]|uniref:hypothetical protein n=1 Tax=Paraflavitalea pollutisoli TaxID=3034143 RepID=UPI0023EB3001|nr:hypothetical protein [Paraflavitalea sp. H1-2-19X]
MRKIIYLIACCSLCLIALSTQAQTESDPRAKSALRRLASAYQQPAYLGFDVLYRYASESNPKQYLDSLRGQYKVHGNKFWSQLDSQETVSNSELVLTVFKEDKLLFLAKAAAGGAPGNPVAMLDSFLVESRANAFTYTSSAAEEIVSLQLPDGGPCKKMTWYIDRKTGYLRRMESLMRSDQLYEPAAQPLLKDAASVYVVVETDYQHYRTGGFGDEVFDLGKYYRKEGGEYIAQAPYDGYKVFLSSTGL